MDNEKETNRDKTNRNETKNSKVFDLADTLKALKEEKSQLEDKLEELKAKIEETDAELTAEMAEQDLPNFTHSGSTFYLKTNLFASPLAGKKDEMIAALKKTEYASLVVEQVNSKTLSSFVKEYRENNKVDVPEFLDGIINVFEKTNVGIRKA